MKNSHDKKLIRNALAALSIAAGFALFCTAGLLAVDISMRSELFSDTAPVFSASVRDGVSLRLFGAELTFGEGLIPSLPAFFASIAERLRFTLLSP